MIKKIFYVPVGAVVILVSPLLLLGFVLYQFGELTLGSPEDWSDK